MYQSHDIMCQSHDPNTTLWPFSLSCFWSRRWAAFRGPWRSACASSVVVGPSRRWPRCNGRRSSKSLHIPSLLPSAFCAWPEWWRRGTIYEDGRDSQASTHTHTHKKKMVAKGNYFQGVCGWGIATVKWKSMNVSDWTQEGTKVDLPFSSRWHHCPKLEGESWPSVCDDRSECSFQMLATVTLPGHYNTPSLGKASKTPQEHKWQGPKAKLGASGISPSSSHALFVSSCHSVDHAHPSGGSIKAVEKNSA